jgi:hypothetical protein
MTANQAVYSFLPWLRHGLGTQITAGGSRRGSINVHLELAGDNVTGGGTSIAPLTQTVELYGPGDIVGVDARMVIRVEPRPWTTNFEPNYLPHIEFYDEDFPWRYTPAPPAGEELMPWLTLIALEEDAEFEENRVAPGQPLPTITVKDLGTLPPRGDLWAWGHVHVNRDLSPTGAEFVSGDTATVLAHFESALQENPDLAHSRILCPRKLKPNTSYHAFLIPTFETGRLAGLRLDAGKVPTATTIAWEDYGADRQDGGRFPYYYRWYFRTGTAGDFEELVRLLKPKPANPQVGVRDMDMQNPGADLPGFAEPLLKLGGALRIPIDGPDPNDQWKNPDPHPFQVALARLINLADDYSQVGDPDPVITPPLYGRWHALVNRLLFERDGTPITPRDNWVHELNLDPRFRVPAGFGTEVIEQHQEEYMKAAWDQLGDILEANRRIRLAQLAREVAVRWYDLHLRPLQSASIDQAFALTGPVHRRIVSDGKTIHFEESLSYFSTTAVSSAFRRITRPRGRLIRTLPFTATIRPDNLLTRMSAGQVTATPIKTAGGGLLTVAALAGKFPLLAEDCWNTKLPNCPNFQLGAPTKDTKFHCESGPPEPTSSDSARFKAALKDLCTLVRKSHDFGQEAPPNSLDIPTVTGKIVAGLNPTKTIPDRIGRTIRLPPHVQDDLGERFQEVMAYPKIDKPMYEPLKDLSDDLFLPNIRLLEPNSLTLLQTNQKFIESYMVGLNHEFARELLWREYMTDQRGSYFRQFWSVEGFFGFNDLTPEARQEKLYDIPALHRWARLSKLGEHDNREVIPGQDQEELVLVIRGELLKRYPTTVIYAQAARWDKTNGVFDNAKPRLIDDLSLLSPDQLKELSRDVVRTPLYEAKVDPDIYFLGFDLTLDEARGDLVNPPTAANAGWFFILKERPGEPRFGLDDQPSANVVTVNDLSWATALPGGQDGAFLPADSIPGSVLQNPAATDPPEEKVQHNEDALVFPAGASSARWAYLLLQAPVMMAVHAAEMLPK